MDEKGSVLLEVGQHERGGEVARLEDGGADQLAGAVEPATFNTITYKWG